jgi:Xaa-Pro aminopeptidase
VLEANETATAAARGGIDASGLDAVARECIRRHGFGRYFTHSLGHGLGLRVHERPRVSALSREVLQSGSVITIEPGVYIPGTGGVRIEDDVLLGDGGCRVLTRSPRELIVL